MINEHQRHYRSFAFGVYSSITNMIHLLDDIFFCFANARSAKKKALVKKLFFTLQKNIIKQLITSNKKSTGKNPVDLVK